MGDVRVLRIIARMNVGGPAQQITGLMRDLDADRFHQTLAVGNVDEGEQDWLELRAPWLADDPRLHGVDGLGRPIAPPQDLRAYRRLRALIRELRPDIVHTHTAKAGLLGRLAANSERVPAVVHTYHGHVLHGYFNPAIAAGIRGAERHLARRSDALLSVGAKVRDELLAARIGTPAQYTVVPPGVVPPRLHERSDARAALGIDAGATVIGFVGRLAGVKRPDRLIAVAEAVAALRRDVVFLVAGGAEADELARLRSMVDRADVRFLGWVGDVGQLYAAVDLVLLTSDNEGMPVSLIEAGMCGRPCVATDVGSVGEVVLEGVTGRVVPVDVTALAEAVVELIDDPPGREAYGHAAHEHTHASFSMQRLVETTQRVYERVLTGGP